MIEISLYNSDNVALIDDADAALVLAHKWKLHNDKWNDYAISSRGILMHRLIMDAKKGQIVDHEDRDGLNNRRGNLRFVTISQNKVNSLYRKREPKGVYPAGKKWTASIVVNNKIRHLGTFADQMDAARAYNEAAKAAFGEFAVLNKVPAVGNCG